MKGTILAAGATALLALLVLAGAPPRWALLGRACPPRAAPPPAPARPPVAGEVPLKVEARWTGNYARDIQPVFDQYCVRCHGANLAENGLRMDSYEGVMKGTQFGSVVTPGAAGASTLAYVITRTAAHKIPI